MRVSRGPHPPYPPPRDGAYERTRMSLVTSALVLGLIEACPSFSLRWASR